MSHHGASAGAIEAKGINQRLISRPTTKIARDLWSQALLVSRGPFMAVAAMVVMTVAFLQQACEIRVRESKPPNVIPIPW